MAKSATTTNSTTGTNVCEISAGIYCISTPVPPQAMPGGFTFNQFLVIDDEPLLFHTGMRSLFPVVREAVGHVLGDPARLRWLDAPNLPHNWECGYLFEAATRTLLCGDLFTHAGDQVAPLTESDVLGPAEAMRQALPDSVTLDRRARGLLEKLAATEPRTLALMHGSS